MIYTIVLLLLLSNTLNLEVSADPPSGETDKIFLWTKAFNNGVNYQLLDIANAASIAQKEFDGSLQTYVFIHGFLSNGLIDWIQESKDTLLAWGPCNVISVQWFAGNTPGAYYLVTARVPYVATDIVTLFSILEKYKSFDPSRVHLIGHSLGAHVAGFVGKKLKNTIPRITGLDPAGTSYVDSLPSVRLDSTDAHYVDILHTNACRTLNIWFDCYGIPNAIGHTDFWPNGGKYQPACKKSSTLRARYIQSNQTIPDTRLYGAVGCDHQMAHQYFTESLKYSTRTTKFLARPSKSFSTYENSSCADYPQYMGHNANPTGMGNFFLRTGSSPPYALADGACVSEYCAILSWYSQHSALVGIGVMSLVVLMVPLMIFAYLRILQMMDNGGDYVRFDDSEQSDSATGDSTTQRRSTGDHSATGVSNRDPNGETREAHSSVNIEDLPSPDMTQETNTLVNT